MRLIDADAIIEVMQKCAENPENKQALLCYRYTQRILEEAPTVEPFAPWHRVEEEMPDLLQFVVVCNDEGKCVVAQYVGYQTDSLTPWRIAYTMYDTDIYDEKECGPVRYWMPIEPPKEDA